MRPPHSLRQGQVPVEEAGSEKSAQSLSRSGVPLVSHLGGDGGGSKEPDGAGAPAAPKVVMNSILDEPSRPSDPRSLPRPALSLSLPLSLSLSLSL